MSDISNKESLISYIANVLPDCYDLDDIYSNSRSTDGDYNKETLRYVYRSYIDGFFFQVEKCNQYNEECKREFKKRIEITRNVFDALGIVYSIKEDILRNDKYNRTHQLTIKYTIPQEKKVSIWNTISESRLLRIKNDSDGWAEKMLQSESAQYLVKCIKDFYVNNILKTTTKKGGIVIYDFGISLHSNYYQSPSDVWYFERLGYKKFSTKEQFYGLKWIVLKSLIEELSSLGAVYVRWEDQYGDYGDRKPFDIEIQPYFPQKTLKDW